MIGQGSFVVIFDESNNRVLMHQRRDFRIWSLPGGHIEATEVPEDAAVREAREETGYQIRIKGFVGKYWRPQIGPEGDMIYLYTGEIIGGEAVQRGKETVGVAWFDTDKLPFRLRPMVTLFVKDAITGANEPFTKTILVPRWQRTLRHIAVSLKVLKG
jgi:8-oxo-dGTP diphosphatase